MGRDCKFKRRSAGSRDIKPVVLIVSEGIKTEPRYFMFVRKLFDKVAINCIAWNGGDRTPDGLLRRLLADPRFKELNRKRGDQAWLVFDVDQNDVDKLKEIQRKAEESKCNVAISNPAFEYWILLHFENGKNITNIEDCRRRLKKYIENYDKSCKFDGLLDKNLIDTAIQRAREIYEKKFRIYRGFPLDCMGTTVYKLMEVIV